MTSPEGRFSTLIANYAVRSMEYLANAYDSLNQNEIQKASEFLWGSMAEAIKAAAAARGTQLRSHKDIWEYIERMARDSGDQELFQAFRDANALHTNFYESGLTREVVISFSERIRNAVGRLLSLVPREFLPEQGI